jgi:two-component system, cell cycle sensor histidine kinase and response regulator CckA
MGSGNMSQEDLLRELNILRSQVTELQESERKHRSLFERASEAICITQDGLIKYFNPAGAELIGYSVEELLAKSFTDLTHPDDVEELVRIYLQRVRGEYVKPGHRFRMISSAGEVKWAESWSASIEWEGRPAVLSMVRDVTGQVHTEDLLRQTRDDLERRVKERTAELQEINDKLLLEVQERRQAEGALRESEERLRLAWETSPDALSISRLKDGTYVDVNHGYTFLTGYARDEVIGRSALDIPFWADPADRGPFAAALAQHGHIRNFETRLRRKEGEERTILVSAGLMMLGDEPHLLAVTKDIEDFKRAEAALRESEQKYRLLAENVSDVIWITDLDLRVTYVSPSVERLNGWTATEWMSFKPSDYLTPGSLELVVQVLGDELAQQGTPGLDLHRTRTLELEQYRKDGTKFWTEVSARFLYDDNGHAVGIVGATRDISERRRTAEAIRSIVEGVSGQIGEGFFESSVVQFTRILDADVTFVGEIRERDQGAVVRTLAFCAGGELKENFEYDLKGAPCETVTERGICSYPKGVAELFPRDKSLRRMQVEAYVGVCLYDSHRKPTGIMAAMYKRPLENVEYAESVLRIFASRAAAEIERKRYEEHLQRLVTAVESAGETIVVTDSEGTIIYVNPTFEETSGYPRQEALGRNPRILKSGQHDRAFYRKMWETLLAGQVWRGRLTNRRKDGTLYEETATISPIRDESGRIVNYVAVKRDITSETMLQKQLIHAQKMEAIGTLAGGMAHDFNNLLQAILGYSDLLLMKKGPGDPDRKRLEVIQHAARDGADLVSRILTFGRKTESQTRPIDLNEEILKAQRLLRRTVPRMIEIKLVLAENLHIIDADPAQIEQVLLNLAVNAQHAMPNGGQLLIETSNVSLSDEYLRTHLGARQGKYALLTVSDTGAGMEPEVLDRIFEPFFTTKANGEGTGLGLSMVHGIVSQHGGYIRCYSEPGRGTSFKIYFPVSAGELISQDLALTREMPAFGTETILLVDDDDRIREMGRQLVEMGGYHVISARSGEEALQIYSEKKGEISLIILDLIMPGIGGSRCLEELLRMDPEVRVVVASGYSENGPTVSKKRTGARGFVKKPYDAKDILGAIRKVLDQGHL